MSLRLARAGSEVGRRLDDPDVALVARARAGERDAFEELVRRHADRLCAVVRGLGLSREAAEEVTQEAFLRAWRGIGAFRGQSQFSTWLFRIGVNEARRRAARERSHPPVRSLDDDRAIDPPDPRAEPQLRVAHAELQTALSSAVRALAFRYRAPLILRDVEGLSTAEAAVILGLSEPAFKSRLHRARAAVRDVLGELIGGVD